MVKRMGDIKKKSVRKSKRKAPSLKNAFPAPVKKNADIKEKYKEVSHIKPPDSIKFYSIKDKLPPEKPISILYFDPMFGYDVGLSPIILQHIQHDIDTLKFSRITHWAKLKTKKG